MRATGSSTYETERGSALAAGTTRSRKPPNDGPSVHRGDRRRTLLLEALDALICEKPYEEISIGAISARAHVSRSAFYFYFDNKPSAVAALMKQMYDQTASAAAPMFGAEGPPRARFEALITGMIAAQDRFQSHYRAVLDARKNDPVVRAEWESMRTSFVEPVASMIDAERAAGHAPSGTDSRALATVLIEMNDYALERIARGDRLPVSDRIEAMITIWMRTIYRTDQL